MHINSHSSEELKGAPFFGMILALYGSDYLIIDYIMIVFGELVWFIKLIPEDSTTRTMSANFGVKGSWSS